MPVLDWRTKKEDILRGDAAAVCALREIGLYGDADAENLLIQGDNLLALKAIAPHYAGKVKCVFIDPPYNTGNAFAQYDDNLEHSLWLRMMYPRLLLLRELLAADGSIWITIDDDEAHYLKVIMDEIFGRKNFVANVVWQKKYSPQNDAKWLSDFHDHIFVYAKDKDIWRPHLMPRSEKMNSRYKNPDNDRRGVWKTTDFSVKTYSENYDYPITLPSGRKVNPPPSRCWCTSRENFERLVKDERIWFGKNGNNVPALKKFLSEVKQGATAGTVWLYSEVGHNQDAKQEVKAFNSEEVFSTPKPERLIQRILHLSTKPGDLVLDSFLGSGTTAAVAHKMGRRYVGVEVGEHAKTHCIPRLQKVMDGERGGISESANWTGGGGFRFCEIAGEVFDENGDINPELDFISLAAHLWFSITRMPFAAKTKTPFLGEHDGRGYALLYNGIVGDKSINGGNVITAKTLAVIRLAVPRSFSGEIIIYANGCRFGAEKMRAEKITFRQIPYDCKDKK